MPLFRFKRRVSFVNAYGLIYGGSRVNRGMLEAGTVVDQPPCFGFGLYPNDVENLPDPRDDGSPATIVEIASGCDRLLEWTRGAYLSDSPRLFCHVVAGRLHQLLNAYHMMPDTPPLLFDARDISAAQGGPSLINMVKRLRQAIGSLGTVEPPVNGKKTGQSGKSRRLPGRPRGSKSAADDLKLYLDWKEANRARGITKREFLQERGLPMSQLAAIERGRAQAKRRAGQK
jgi:hypothetical protein